MNSSAHDPAPAWFCVRARPKHEHIAAARLREAGLEVFLPRLRFKKGSVRGPVWGQWKYAPLLV